MLLVLEIDVHSFHKLSAFHGLTIIHDDTKRDLHQGVRVNSRYQGIKNFCLKIITPLSYGKDETRVILHGHIIHRCGE
jgi:hypothetical protein